MSRPLIQIGTQVREMNDAELAQWKLDIETAQAAEAEAEAEAQTAAAIRHSALTKLAALGFTETEIAALVDA